MEPQRRYTQVVKKGFHISMAALDISTSNEDPAQVMCGYEGRNYLLCTLKKPSLIQCALDLEFQEGTEVSFATNGKCHVHLTGYLTDGYLDELEDEVEDEQNEEVEGTLILPKSTKRVKAAKADGPPAKKSKPEKSPSVSSTKKVENEEDDDSELGDSDFEENEEDVEEESDDDFEVEAEEEEVEEEDSGEEEEEEEAEFEEDENSDEEMSDDDDDIGIPLVNGDAKQKIAQSQSKMSRKEKKAVKQPQQQNELGKKQNESKKDKNKGQLKTQNKEIGKQNQKEKNKLFGNEQKTPNKDQKTPNKEQKTPNKDQKSPKDQKTPGKDQGKTPKKRTLQGGVIVEDIKEGNGEPVKNGKFVHVYYEGRLKDNNKLFDSTTKGPGFSFRVGKGEVIKGWDIGLAGMKVGGKRKIICPPGMAYGHKGSPPAIPPNSSLVFEVELKRMN